MPTPSTRLGLKVPSITDNFLTQDLIDNWILLDANPGIFVAQTDLPTWGATQAGRFAFELDAGLLWFWDGAAWHRWGSAGLLGRTQRTADISTTATSPVTAVTTAVQVPAGDRNLLVVAEIPAVRNDQGVSRIVISRGATVLTTFLVPGDTGLTAPEQPQDGNASIVVPPPGVGGQTFAVQFHAEPGFGGTAELRATPTSPIALSVIEV